MWTVKVQVSLRICAVSPEPTLLTHTSSESRGTFRQKARSLAHLNGWACAVKICHDGMLEDTNSLDSAQLTNTALNHMEYWITWRSLREQEWFLSFWKLYNFSYNYQHWCPLCLSLIWAMSWENPIMPSANNKDTDQPAHPRSPISTFVVHCLDSIIPLVSILAISCL